MLQNYSLINTHPLKIVGQSAGADKERKVYFHIEMQLMALPGVGFNEIKHIIYHPIAIAQRREYLDTLPPYIKISEAKDTAGAAKMVREREL